MNPSVADVRRAVQVHFKLTREQIQAPDRHRYIAHPRQMAMAMARDMTKASLPEIARHFGDKDHTTVLAGVARTFQRTRADEGAALDYTFVARLARDLSKQRRERERDWVDRLHRGEVSWPVSSEVPK